jgi:hypothetical protein
MFSDVPNLVSVFGYTNASWTLKSDLISEWVCRLLATLRRSGMRQATPRNRDPERTGAPWLDLSSGYVQRSLHLFPQQGTKPPWQLHQNYLRDLLSLRWSRIDDGVLRFLQSGARAASPARGGGRIKSSLSLATGPLLHEPEMRHRGPAQRRQVHPLQRAHQGRHRGGELPFCTIEPNVGVVELPDARLGQLAAIAKPEQIVPAIVEFVDIAGLVAGASRARASATSSSPTCARPTRSSTSCAASTTRTWSTSPARSTRSPTSR